MSDIKKHLKRLQMDLDNVDDNLRILCIFYNSNCEGCKNVLCKEGSGCIRKELIKMTENVKKGLDNLEKS